MPRPDAIDTSLSPSEAVPALLALFRAQAGRRRPIDLLRQLERDGFVAPSMLDQRLVHRLDGIALDAAADFEAVQLSPVAPLGVCSVLAPTSQDRTLSAVRGTEVVSDPTNLLALVCAQRIAANRDRTVRLCSCHQVLRAQALPPVPGFSRHFRLFVLAEAGRARADDGFEVEAVTGHLAVFDRIFDDLAAIGCAFPNRRATVLAGGEVLGDRVEAAIARRLPHVAIARERLEAAYYDGLRVLFGADDRHGTFRPIADVGRFDWVARLVSHRRYRFVASGLGIQLAPLAFRPE